MNGKAEELSGLKLATSIVYRELAERARLLGDVFRGLEPMDNEAFFPELSDAAIDELAPAYDLVPVRATGT